MPHRKHICSHPSQCIIFCTFVVALAVVAPPEAAPASWEIIALPDTQNYTKSTDPEVYGMFMEQTEWIVNHRASENIVFVTHLGDLVQHGDGDPANLDANNRTEWQRAHLAMTTMDGVVPYSTCFGNHDLDYVETPPDSGLWIPTGRSNCIHYFGNSMHQGGSSYGGTAPNDLSFYQTFSAGGYDFLHINLNNEYRDFTPGYPGQVDLLVWAQGIINDHPGIPTIISTHDYLKSNGTRSTAGESLWFWLVKPNPLVVAVLCGHVNVSPGDTAQRTDVNDVGETVLQVLCDYQSLGGTGNGFFGKMRFDSGSSAVGSVTFKAYSPRLDDYLHGPSYNFDHTAFFGSSIHIDNVPLKIWAGGGTNQWNLDSADSQWRGAVRYYRQDELARFDDTATTRTIDITATVTPILVTVENSAGHDFIINSSSDGLGGKISGRGKLNKLGTGKLILTGRNDFTGGVSLAGGTVVVTGSANLGEESSALTIGAATLEVAAGFTTTRPIVLADTGSTIQVDNGIAYNQQGTISGTGNLNKTGGGTLILTDNNTYSGATYFNAGMIRVASLSGLGNGNALIFNGGGLQWASSSSFDPSVHSMTFNGEAVLDTNGNSVTLANAIGNGGPGGLTKTGLGTLVLTGASTYIGNTTISEGTLQIGNGGTTGSITGNVVNDAALAFNRSDTWTFANQISGSGSVTQVGSGTLILTGSNTYIGPTHFNAGLIRVAALSSLGTGNALIFNGGGLQWAASSSFDPSVRTMTFNGEAVLNTNGNSITLANAIGNSASGGLTKTGLGTLIVAGDCTYTGLTKILAGTLQTSATNLHRDILNNAALVFNELSDSTYGGTLSGSGTMTKIGGGTLTLTGNVSTVAFVNTGRIVVGPGSTFSGDVTIESAGRFETSGGTLNLQNLTNRGTLSGSLQVGGIFSNQSSGSMRIVGGQKVQLNGPSGANAGLLELIGASDPFAAPAELECSGPFMNSAGTGLITGRNGTLRFNGGLTNQGSIGLSYGPVFLYGPISNTGSIVLGGGATATFYGDLAQNGSLVVSALGASRSNATFYGAFSGTGGFAGGGDVFFFGQVRPGNSAAQVTLGGNVVMGQSATTKIELGGLTPGSQYDKINVTGTATLNGTLDVTTINGFRPAHNNSFDILHFGSRSGDFALKNLDLGGRLSLIPQYTGNDLILTAVQGGSGSWRINDAGNASVPGNWSDAIPNGAGDVATLGPVITTAQTVTVDAPTTLGGITFNNLHRYTLAGPQAITLDNGASAASILVAAAPAEGHLLSAPLNLLSDLVLQVNAGSLKLGGAINDPLGKKITKLGAGTVIISGEQHYGPGTVLQFGGPGGGFAPDGGPAPVPEPATVIMLAAGGLGLLVYAWRQRRARRP